MKIVSLLPSATEIVFALGLGDQLEGVTYECDYPAEARSKPVVADSALPQDRPLSAGQVDAIVRDLMERQEPIQVLDRDLIRKIQPDLILAQDLCRVCAIPSGQVLDALKDLGSDAEVLSLDPTTLDQVLESILQVGRATGAEARADSLCRDLRSRIDRVKRTAFPLPSISTLGLEWSDPPFAAGHWVPGMIDLAGGRSVGSTAGEPSVQVTWHEIATAAPEVIAFMPCGYYLDDAEVEAERLYELPDFAGTPAARAGAVFATDASSYFSRPGPRLVDGLEILAWAIHPEAFPEPGMDRVARVRG